MPVNIGDFFKVPNKFFGSGLAAKLGSSTAIVYTALCECANRAWPRSSDKFSISDRSLAADTGLSPRTIGKARRSLVAARLVTCERERGCSFTYTLLPQAFKPVSRQLRQRQKRRPRAHQSMPQSLKALLGTHVKYATPYGKAC